jgi:hypothetical protein
MRKDRQRKRERYQKLREDLQLSGDIPVVPEGAIRDERVPTSGQGEQHLPQLVGRAVRKGWAVPEERKPGLIDELMTIIDNPEVPEKVKVAAFQALRAADKDQYERDNPGAVKKLAIGPPVNVSLQMNIQAAAVIKGMVERGEVGEFEPAEELPTSNQPGAFGTGGLSREMEASAALEEDQRRAGESVQEAE